MSEPKRGRGYVYDLQYHLVWFVKYRRKVFVGQVEQALKTIICELCDKHEIEILGMETDKDISTTDFV